MPSRWVCVAIVACWLGSNGWLLWQDVWPGLQPGQPPPFTIDLVEEVQLDKQPETVWSIFVNGEETWSYRATTWVTREPVNDLYALHFKAKLPESKPNPDRVVQSMISLYRVTPTGDLRTLDVEVETTPPVKVKAAFRGEVRDDRFFGHYHVGGPGVLLSFKGDLDPVPVSHNGAVFLPMHPLQRFPGLRPGQSWRVPSVKLLSGLGLGGGSVRFLEARVLPTPDPLPWKAKETPCLVIEYGDDDDRMRTWVEQEGGLVLKQEAVVGTERWVLQRDR
jgi:hypothetical protein